MPVKINFGKLATVTNDDLSKGKLQNLLTAIGCADFSELFAGEGFDGSFGNLSLWIVYSHGQFYAVTVVHKAIGEHGQTTFITVAGVLKLYVLCSKCDEMTTIENKSQLPICVACTLKGKQKQC